jgi:hypothetical protein
VRRLATLCLLVLVVVGDPVSAQNTTTRVSVATGGAQANQPSQESVVSGNGRFVAFVSSATNLVPGDSNNQPDIFVHDRQTGTTERVNVGSGGAQANHVSYGPSISGDGRFVVFTSVASNLITTDTNGTDDVFVRDRQTGTTRRASVATSGLQANNFSIAAGISGDGRYVLFSSPATNLVGNDSNSQYDVFRYDQLTGTTLRVSLSTTGTQGSSHSLGTDISSDGRLVAFVSAAPNLVPGDTNGFEDVFVRDVQTSTTTRVSIGPGGAQGNGDSLGGRLSDDGRFVAFVSRGTTLDAGGGRGVFLHDRQSSTTSPVSVIPATTAVSLMPDGANISGNGRYVCFSAYGVSRIFDNLLFDRLTLAKSRVSVANSGAGGNQASSNCSVSGDGTIAAFESSASNLIAGDTNALPDVFVRTMFPAMTLDRTSLTFRAVTSGGAFVSQTAAQVVRLTQDGIDTVAWSAASSEPWLQVSPASGSGTGALSIGVAPAAVLPPSGTVTGKVFISLTGSTNTVSPIDVSLTLQPNGTSVAPFGTVDTPTDHRTGVTGAVPFTGWALDDIEVTRVSICRAAFGGEVPPVDPNCGGAAEIFVGFGVFIDGARPDVAAAFPTHPLATRAGWGFMVLTNMLPNQGNGTYAFTMRAQDREGTWVVLGTRTMTCANASATLPFGTLDTPFQGGVASGTSFINFGWALTPLPKTIPVNGSTMGVLIDGVLVGSVDYNHARPDIQALFPGLNNTNGAVGFHIFDTTALANGLHTIAWTVTDNAGAIEGLGSRFFTVANGVGAVTAAATAATLDVDDLPLETTPLVGRRGWDLDAPYQSFVAGAGGLSVIRSEEVSRVELQLGDGHYTGHLRTSAGLTPLPIGSRLDPATNTLTWAPGVGFIGRYDFVFVRSLNGRAVARREVRIILAPKGRGSIGPQVVVDVPRSDGTVNSPFLIGGWAVDLDASDGTGVTTLHAWAYPSTGGAPIFLGATASGGVRPDVAAIHGDQFKASGFGLIAQGLPPGDYDLALFAWSTETMGFVAPTVVRVRVDR